MSTIIKIEKLYKEYRLGVIGHGTLYRDMQSWWASVRGKEDPNSLLGYNSNENRKGQILVLKDINLDIRNGEVLGIIGANGAGKSTLLKILSRVTAPSKGVIKVRGRIASLLEVGTGFHPELTGRENIYLNGAINGMNRHEVTRKMDEIVDFAGVELFLDTPVKRYSTGMHVRLGFAVAAHLESEIIVVDEVLAVGDASFQKKAIGKMQDVSKGEGRTVLFVSHNMDSIKMLCKRVILLQNGKVTKDSLPEEVVNYYLESAEAETTGPEIIFPDKPDNDYQVLGFSILNDQGEKSNYLDRTKPFQILIEYNLKKHSDDLSVSFGVSTASRENGVYINTTVFQWSNRHYRRYKYNDENVACNPGKYRAVVNIPGYILNSGKYKLNVHLIYAGNWYEFNKRGIVFVLFDLGSSHTFKFGGRSSGLLAMPLDWVNRALPVD